MKINELGRKTALIAWIASLSLSTLQSAQAAPGPLETAPLFLSTIIQPNVYMTIDDSGSMDWDPMFQDGAAGIPANGGRPVVAGYYQLYYFRDASSFSHSYNSRGLPPANGANYEWDLGWAVKNHNANLSYYNPAIDYTPWPGTNADGTPMFIDANETAVLKDPFNPAGQTVNLTVSHTFDGWSWSINSTWNWVESTVWLPRYFIWDDDIQIPVTNINGNSVLVDSNNDGIYSSADGVATTPNGIVDFDDGRRAVDIVAGTPEMQNFANWFQYYRSRMKATKAIIGNTINSTDASRMGMRLFNSGILEDSSNNNIHIDTMSLPSNKRRLLESFYDFDIQPRGTPMRSSLRDVGEYFTDTGANAPILPSADGGECQQNFNILMGDGFWNGGSPTVNNTDGDSNSNYDGGSYADSFSNTLADVAMRYYESDLRTDLPNNVPIQTGVDEANHQHLVTFTIAFGITGSLDPLVDNPLATGFAWTDAHDNEPNKVDDMWHAAYNGRGRFFSAQQPDELSTSLQASIADIAERTATAAAVSINSSKLTTESVVYLAQFNTNRWQGDLVAKRIIDLQDGTLEAGSRWNAGEKLTTRDIDAQPRVIATYDGTDGVLFKWDKLTTAHKNDLKTNATGGTDSDNVAMARLDYLKGDRSNEGSGYFFRERLSRLGDLVNSGPVYVGKPNLNWPEIAPFPTGDNAYSNFKSGPAAERQGIVYAGSNDGVLHGFRETNGKERIGYIPSYLFSTESYAGLHYLTEQNYLHRYYNDLTPTVSDIYANLGNGLAWHTILISGQRGGGRGLSALNVTDPTLFKNNDNKIKKVVVWEFDSSDDADLGYTYSKPQIALANNGKWVAIFGNGYNDTGSGEAQLFIIDIEAGADGSWDDGDYIKISTRAGGAGDRNGLTTPALADLNGDGTVDRVYAGDLQGKMWAFDLSSGDVNDWKEPVMPLFVTKDARPITAQATLSRHPTQADNGSNTPNVMVFFGSGQYLTDTDKTDNSTNHFYGVWDRGIDKLDSSDLVEQVYLSGFTDSSGNPARVLSNNEVDYVGGKYGWHLELEDSGERAVTLPVVRGDLVFFNTFVPTSDPCSVGGYGYRMAVDLTTGGSPTSSAFDSNGDGFINADDAAFNGDIIGIIAGIQQEGYLPEPVFIEDVQYTADEPAPAPSLDHIPKGRFSWQELIQ